MKEIVLVRHGESVYNALGKYTGWTDCELTLEGVQQAMTAGRLLKKKGYVFDVAYSSILRRAARTLDFILDELQLNNIPVVRNWKLNERCYGGLEELGRTEALVKYGEETIRQCRQDYYFRPPTIEDNSRDMKRSNSLKGIQPKSESMYDAATRVLSCWNDRIIPDVASGKRVLVVAHADILRLLTGHLKGLSPVEIAETPPFPNAVPIVYELDENFKLVSHHLIKDIEEPIQVSVPRL